MDETPEQTIARLTQQVSDLTSTNTELTGKLQAKTVDLREKTHKATFREVATKNGVRPKAIDALYRELGYDPGEADEADPAAIEKLINDSKEEHDFYFEPPAPESTVVEPGETKPKPTPGPIAKPPIGGGRGKNPPVPEKFRVTKENTQDPGWLLTNSKAYNEANRNGTLEIVG